MPTRPMRSRAAQPSQSVPLADTSVPWAAKLIQPRRAVRGSTQPVVVEVSAPVVLDTQTVEAVVGPVTVVCGWLGEPGQTRQAAGSLHVPAQGGPVTVRVDSVLLSAGKLHVV